MDESQIQQVRRFNRSVTQRVGALTDNYLGRGRPLGESRVLFEIGAAGVSVRDLRARLSLDSGYLSRLLRSLEGQGLVSTQRSSDDARVRHVALTRKGRKEFQALDRCSQDVAAALLSPLSATQRERMIAAMTEVERFMRLASVTITPTDAAGVDARRCLDAYLGELDARFDDGFDPSIGPSAGPGEFAPPRGVFLVARLDGAVVGCGGLTVRGRRIGEIKRMWVAPTARGWGIAQRLLTALEGHAVALGLRTLRLDTHRALTEARALYVRNGYQAIASYNDNPYAHHWFEKRGL